MLNSTAELVALWASLSPSLLAFCFSHLIVAVLLLGGGGGASDIAAGAGECALEAGSRHDAQVQAEQEDPAAVAASAVQDEECSDEVVGEADTNGVQLEASERSGQGEDVSVACGDEEGEEEEDELMMRAEEFIQRMNRSWRTENVRAC
ncbi:hypothetical protein ACP4OV_015519 [Aristida adscensionis]